MLGVLGVPGAMALISAAPQAPVAKVDFVRDVQPILRDHCYECHGPDKQMNAFRLDRRRDALRGGNEVALVPGSPDTSKLYLRLLSSDFGTQMPKDGTIATEQIDTIRRWIEQGLDWPDAASGESADAKRPTPPLMHAALRGDLREVTRLLDAGADPNAANDAGATALMWSLTTPPVARLLVERGANVNARSEQGRTPLIIAAGMPGGRALARLLLDRGAKANVAAAGMTPLSEAARVGDPDLLSLLLSRGAHVSDEDPLPLAMALLARCSGCVDVLAARMPPPLLGVTMALASPPFGDASAVVPLLARGADPSMKHPNGMNVLMLASATDFIRADAVRALIARGLDVNTVGPNGVTALALARRHGATPVVDALLAAGAVKGPAPGAPPVPDPAPSAHDAVLRSLPLLQRADVTFLRKTGCLSCHNNSLTAMTMAAARARGLPLDEGIARSQRDRSGVYLEDWRERVLQGHGIPGDHDTISYLLAGLAAERYPRDAATDAMARFLRLWQYADGSWHIEVHRPPIESSDVEVTVMSMRALRAYAPAYDAREANAAIRRAAAWLETAPVRFNEDRAFKLMGLFESGARRDLVDRAARDLLAQQREDGGWAQIPSIESDAYATGEALVALASTGRAHRGNAQWDRGAEFLRRTQLADGSWLVRSRAIGFQPQFDAGFPHGRDQFISAAGTNWATQALILAGRPKGR